MSQTNNLSSRNFGIDLARTLAISMVILVHTTGIGFGRFGVQLFFCISGYLLGDYYQGQSRIQFLFHRAFRLFPLAIFFIIFFYLKNINSPAEIILNLFLVQNFFWNSHTFPGGWSISSEWIFSIFLVLILPKHKNKLIYFFITTLLLQLASGIYVFLLGGVSPESPANTYLFRTWVNTTNPFINLGFFISGILILIYKDKIMKINKFILLGITLIMILEDEAIGHFMLGWQIAIPALFILCLKTRSRRGGLTLICTFIGKRTYGTFFVHFLIWNNLNLFFSETKINYLVNDPLGKFIQFILVYLLAILGGSLTYIFIEKPSLIFSYKLIRKS